MSTMNPEISLYKEAPLSEPERQYYFMEKAKILIQELVQKAGRPLTFCVTTFGCQMNARDSEKLCGILKNIGYIEQEDEEKADFVIYNTCTVGKCQSESLRSSGAAWKGEKKESLYDHRVVRLHDAGAGGSGKN